RAGFDFLNLDRLSKEVGHRQRCISQWRCSTARRSHFSAQDVMSSCCHSKPADNRREWWRLPFKDRKRVRHYDDSHSGAFYSGRVRVGLEVSFGGLFAPKLLTLDLYLSADMVLPVCSASF